MSTPAYIYEVVDASDEETYYTLGVYASLEAAIAAASCDPTEWGGPGWTESDESATINIKRREMGAWDPCGGVVVWSQSWSCADYDEAADDYPWVAGEPKIKAELNQPLSEP